MDSCPYCGARNEGPRPWGSSLVCPSCEDCELDHDVALANLTPTPQSGETK